MAEMMGTEAPPMSFENIDGLAYDLRQQDPTQNWDIGGIDRASELGTLMGNQGITSLEGLYQNHKGWGIGDKSYGFLGDYNNDNTFGSKASDTIQDANRVGWSARGEGAVGYHLNNKQFGPVWGSTSDYNPKLAQAIGLAMMFVPGLQGAGAALGSGLGLTGTMASVVGNGLIGGSLSKLAGGDFLKGAALSGLTAGVGDGLNIGSTVGISDPYWQNVANGAFGGGVSSGLGGGNILQGAAQGAITSGLNGIGGSATMAGGEDMSMYDLPGTMGGGLDVDDSRLAGGSSADPTSNYYTGNIQQQMQPQASMMPASSSGGGNSISSMFANGIPNFSGGTVPMGDALGGLLGLYSAWDQRRQSKRMMGDLQSLYGMNSPYAKQMEQTLARRDAASGRRSQYGPRAAQFSAAMADTNARMMPTLMQLQMNKNNAGLDMARGALTLGSKFMGPGFTGVTPQSMPQGGMAASLPSLQTQMPPANYGMTTPMNPSGGGMDFNSFMRNYLQQNKLGGIPQGN